MGNYLDNSFHPDISFRHVLKQNRISNSFGESETPSFSIVDLSVRYQYNRTIGATFGVQNLLDETYYEHLSRSVKGIDKSIYAPGRNIYFSLTVDLM